LTRRPGALPQVKAAQGSDRDDTGSEFQANEPAANEPAARGQGAEEGIMAELADLDERTRTELEAAAFRTLVEHFRAHPEVQNIDLMNLAGFCRNCLSKWYRAAAEQRGLELSYEQAREIVYGMPYAEWKAKHQTEATPEQQAAFAERQAEHG
jgi:uncharacterized protein